MTVRNLGFCRQWRVKEIWSVVEVVSLNTEVIRARSGLYSTRSLYRVCSSLLLLLYQARFMVSFPVQVTSCSTHLLFNTGLPCFKSSKFEYYYTINIWLNRKRKGLIQFTLTSKWDSEARKILWRHKAKRKHWLVSHCILVSFLLLTDISFTPLEARKLTSCSTHFLFNSLPVQVTSRPVILPL